MLSTSGKNWKETSINQRIVDKAKNDNDLTEIQAKIIIKRKFTELEVASLSNNIEVLNPFLRNQDFKNGHYILDKSIKNNEKVLIIGDYDVDGCVSTSLFVILLLSGAFILVMVLFSSSVTYSVLKISKCRLWAFLCSLKRSCHI